MDIPLVLSSPSPDRLSYGFPVWYRVMMGAILAIVIAALVLDGGRPGFVAWFVMTIIFLAAVYEDRWTFDATKATATHRGGLLFSARAREIAFEQIVAFHIVPIVKGTVPGTEDEKAENEAALKGERTDESKLKRSRHKKPYLNLEIECADGTHYLVDHVSARRIESLRSMASRIAAHCGKRVQEA